MIHSFYFAENNAEHRIKHLVSWTERSTGHWQPPMKIFKNTHTVHTK